ncbi:MAG: RDD family protein [Marmoricola sp.]
MPEYASWPRRIAALVIDWTLSTLITIGLVGLGDYAREGSPAGWIVLLVFAVEVSVLTTLAGGSFGQLLTRVRVLRTDGRPLSLLLAIARTVLICLVIPPLVYKPDTGRGLHDLWTGSAAYRR